MERDNRLRPVLKGLVCGMLLTVLLTACGSDIKPPPQTVHKTAVIVELIVPTPAAGDEDALQKSIGDVQAKVMALLDEQTRAKVRTYANLPNLAFAADGQTLQRLLASPFVAAIRPDRVSRPIGLSPSE